MQSPLTLLARRNPRWRRLSVAGALALALLAPAGPAHAADGADATTITDGHVVWGIKESWRTYTGGGTLSGGVEQLADGRYRWPVEQGTFDEETGALRLDLAGSIHYALYCDSPGFCQLDSTFEDLSVEISAERQVIRGTYVGRPRNDPGSPLERFEDAVLAVLDLGDSDPEVAGGTTTWTEVPSVAGDYLAIYAPGTPIDPVTISYAGPGGKPDLSERWAVEGLPAFAPAAERPVTTGTEQFRRVYVAENDDLVYLVEMPGPSEGRQRYTFTALDAQTLEPVGATEFLQGTTRYLATAFDPESDTIFSLSDEVVDGVRRLVVHAASWNPATSEFDSQQVASVSANPTDNRTPYSAALTWNAVAGELLWVTVRPDERTAHQVHTLTPAEDGWAHDTGPVALPAIFATTAAGRTVNAFGNATGGLTTANVAVARDGSYVFASGAQHTDGDNVRYENPLMRMVRGAGGAWTAAFVDDTVAVHPDSGATKSFGRISVTADGSLLGYGDGGTDSGRVVVVDIVDGQVVADPIPVTAGGEPSPVHDVAADASLGLDYAVNTTQAMVHVLRGSAALASIPMPELRPSDTRLFPFSVARDGDLITQVAGDSGEVVLRRYDLLGVAPTLTTHPEPVTVELANATTPARASFAAAADGSPAPTYRWQVRTPSATRFVDLAGATDATLSVDARPSDHGSQYRVIASNAAGDVASEPATLTLRYRPVVQSDLRDVTTVEGTDVTFTTAGAGSPVPSVTWQRRVSGYWQNIALDDENFTVAADGASSSLTVTDTNVDQSGSLFRARFANELGSVSTSTAELTVTPSGTIPDGGLDLDGVVLEWAGSGEMQARPPFGSSNYFSAGISDGKEATYRVTDGDISVVHVADGSVSAPTYATRGAQTQGDVEQRVRFAGGDAEVAADGSATVEWDGAWSVNFYDGLVPFWFSDPVLTVAADGTAQLTADLDGYAASMGNPNNRTPLDLVEDVPIGTFEAVEIDPTGRFAITPDYAGVEVEVPAGYTPQNRTAAGWGAWPQEFVDFHIATGLSSYWYSSGGAADSVKPAAPMTIDFTDAVEVETPVSVDPAVSVTLGDTSVAFGTATSATVTVTAPGTVPTGRVDVKVGTRTLGAALVRGTASVTLPANLPVGRHPVVVTYAGDGRVNAVSGRATLTVTKTEPSVRLKVPSTIGRGKSAKRVRAKVVVTIPGRSGATFAGQVVLKDGGRILAVGKVRQGKGTIRLGKREIGRLRPGTHFLTAIANPTSHTRRAVSEIVSVRVRR
jgi:hypothetical protein